MLCILATIFAYQQKNIIIPVMKLSAASCGELDPKRDLKPGPLDPDIYYAMDAVQHGK
jgi:hypothetical protein